MRGNVDTRLRKLADGEYDALVLALAGLERLGRERRTGCSTSSSPPPDRARWRSRRGRAGGRVDGLADPDATACVTAERELTARSGPRATRRSARTPRPWTGGELELTAWVGLPDGSAWIADRLRGGPDGLGRAVAQRLLSGAARCRRELLG